jgi:hypothetical protein
VKSASSPQGNGLLRTYLAVESSIFKEGGKEGRGERKSGRDSFGVQKQQNEKKLSEIKDEKKNELTFVYSRSTFSPLWWPSLAMV